MYLYETSSLSNKLAEFQRLSATKYISRANIAKIYVGLGEDEKVIELLEEACDERAVRLPWLLVDPILEHLHDNARYQDVRRRAGIPYEQQMGVSGLTVVHGQIEVKE